MEPVIFGEVFTSELGTTLARKYKAAIKEQNVQVEGHCGLSANLPADLVETWDKLCVQWENDRFPKSMENLFHVDGECEYYY